MTVLSKKWHDKWWKHFSANSETIWWLELFPYRDQHLDATCRMFLSFVMFWTGVLFWGFFPHLGHHKDFFAVVLGAPHNLWGLKVVFGRTCGCKCLFRFVLCHATVTPVVPHLMFHLETSCGTKCKQSSGSLSKILFRKRCRPPSNTGMTIAQNLLQDPSFGFSSCQQYEFRWFFLVKNVVGIISCCFRVFLLTTPFLMWIEKCIN